MTTTPKPNTNANWIYVAVPTPLPKALRRLKQLGAEVIGSDAILFRISSRNGGTTKVDGVVAVIVRECQQPDRVAISLNPPLARMLTAPSATDRRVLAVEQLPAAVRDVPLGEVPDILPREASRLNLRGIFTAGQFVLLTESELRAVMGTSRGSWWAKALRGEDVPPAAPSYLSRGLVLGKAPQATPAAADAIRQALRNAIADLTAKALTAKEVWVELAADMYAVRKRIPVRALDAAVLEGELFRRISLENKPAPERISIRFLGLRPLEQPALALFDTDEPAA